MALITILDENDQPRLIHTSQIGPPVIPRPLAPDPWPAVWDRFDGSRQEREAKLEAAVRACQ